MAGGACSRARASPAKAISLPASEKTWRASTELFMSWTAAQVRPPDDEKSVIIPAARAPSMKLASPCCFSRL